MFKYKILQHILIKKINKKKINNKIVILII